MTCVRPTGKVSPGLLVEVTITFPPELSTAEGGFQVTETPVVPNGTVTEMSIGQSLMTGPLLSV